MTALLAFTLLQAKRSFDEALALARKEALAWNKEVSLLKVAYVKELLYDVDPQADRAVEIEFLFGGRDGCAPGEMKTKSWTIGPADAAPRAGTEGSVKTYGAALPEKVAGVGRAFDACRREGLPFGAKMELQMLHGRAFWTGTKDGRKIYFADGLSGDYVMVAENNFSIPQVAREQTFAITSWKQVVDAIEKDLKGWRAAGAQISTLRGSGKGLRALDRELGLVDWDLQVYIDKPAPAMLFYRISNGNVAMWALDAVPSDVSHVAPLASWSLSGSGARIAEHASVKPFLASRPPVAAELAIDAAHMKSGEAVLKITNLDNRSALEVVLDKKGAVKSAAPKK